MIEQRRPGVYYDVDGTIFKSSLLEKVVARGVADGIFSQDAFESAMEVQDLWQDNNNEGTYISYTDTLVEAFIAQISGVRVDRFKKLVDEVVAKQHVRRFRFPRTLMRIVRPSHTGVVISGSPKVAVDELVGDMGVEHVFGSTFSAVDGVYTGEAESVGDKAAIRRRLIEMGIVLPDGDIAVGDTMGDKSILRAVEYPILLNPSATLADYGRTMGWPMVLE